MRGTDKGVAANIIGLTRADQKTGTFGVSYEDCYAREFSRFVCNIC